MLTDHNITTYILWMYIKCLNSIELIVSIFTANQVDVNRYIFYITHWSHEKLYFFFFCHFSFNILLYNRMDLNRSYSFIGPFVPNKPNLTLVSIVETINLICVRASFRLSPSPSEQKKIITCLTNDNFILLKQ